MGNRNSNIESTFNLFPDEVEIQMVQDFLWKVFHYYVAEHIGSISENKLINLTQGYTSLKDYINLSHQMLKDGADDIKTLKPLNLPEEVSKEFRSALELIILTVRPEKIFMVRHEDVIVPDNPICLELIIILSSKFHQKLAELEPLMDFSLSIMERISFSLHVSSRLTEAFEEGLLFYVLNCKLTNLIYDDGQKPLPKIDTVKLLENSAKAESTFLSNNKVAISFYHNAKHLKDENNLALSCFMLQQAAELSLRALITAFKGVDKKTHSISELKKHVAMIAPQLNNIFSIDTGEDQLLLKLLEDVYLKSRYETGFVISQNQLDTLIERVGHLLELSKAIFEDNFRKLDIAE